MIELPYCLFSGNLTLWLERKDELLTYFISNGCGMKNRAHSDAITVDELIVFITQKLLSNRSVLQQSLGYGRLSWRRRKNGQTEIELEPKL